MDFNSFINSLYEWAFNLNFNNSPTILNMMYNTSGFLTLGVGLIVVSFIFLIVFYKFWDPVKKPLQKWILTLLLVGIAMVIISYAVLYSNVELMQYMGEYSGEAEKVNPQWFMFKIASVSFLYGILLSAFLSMGIKFLSVSNKNNPF